jgi:gamma-glutamyltranspeptidase/glutathione hydrolase
MAARRFRAISFSAILAFAAWIGEARQQTAADPWAFPVDRTPVTYGRSGMVSTTDRVASETGVEVLRRGGNAVDAAVATHFALAVVNPEAGNIGGGGIWAT